MEIKPQIRYLKEMADVVYDKEFVKNNPNLELYYVYRGVKKQNGIRYDITVIPPQMLGEEFVRTKGNRNSNDFPELYAVLKGEAIFLLQKAKEDVVEDVLAIEVKKGDFVLVPAEYAVMVINPLEKELKLGNWVSEKNENIYDELERMRGMCYFAIAKKSKVKSQKSKVEWIRNNNYKRISKLRFEKPLKKKLKSLDFLKG